MKVKATKKMAQVLSNNIKEYKITLEQFTERNYSLFVNLDSYKNENDYNINTGLFNTIKVTYPPEYYAYPSYLSTNDLVKCFNKSSGTLQSFIEKVREFVEI
jgi:hypothetical protein